jgi:hypothetical protein
MGNRHQAGATALLAVAALASSVAFAGEPGQLRVQITGQFDANRMFSGVFSTTGALNALGSVVDSPRPTGNAIHVVRTMTTSDSESLVFNVTADQIAESVAVPIWCAPPASVPAAAFLLPQVGNWNARNGTGKYAAIQGTGSWAAWIVVDSSLGRPVAATECMVGSVQID